MANTQLIGLDWGTTQLRAYRFASDGRLAEARHLPAGVMRVASDDGALGFERAFEQACGDWISVEPSSTVIACGMIGSAQGWHETAYLEAPTTLDALGRAVTRFETQSGIGLHVIPGVIARGVLPDVMRGEETQVAGAADLAGPGWIALPGTHSKWVRVADRCIVQFHTFMTGEVFAALCEHTILGRTMRRAATPDLQAFDRGVEVSRAHDARAGVLSTMFSTRTLGLVGALAAEAQADYLSGLLIGSELAALADLREPHEAVVLVGTDELCERYRRALEAFGHAPPVIARHATERGLWRVAGAAGLVC